MRTREVLWITDPWETLDHAKDTTLRLAEECLRLGIPSSWCDVRSIRWEDGEVLLDACRILRVGAGREASSIELAPPKARRPREFGRLAYRTDPPVDLAYVHPLQLLALGTEGKAGCEIVSPAEVLLLANEKTEAGPLGALMPPTRISSQLAVLEAFGRSEGKAVLKPLHEAQSHGVELLDWSTPAAVARAAESLRGATEGFTRPALLQRYLPGILNGEQRLWFVNGRLLATARKLPKSGEFRINMDQGGSVQRTKLTAGEKRAALKIGARLRARKVRMAAVDLIDGFVTDYNITSPGLIVQMERALGENLAGPIVRALIARWR